MFFLTAFGPGVRLIGRRTALRMSVGRMRRQPSVRMRGLRITSWHTRFRSRLHRRFRSGLRRGGGVGCCQVCRTPVIYGSQLRAIHTRAVLMRNLGGGRGHMLFAARGRLRGSRLGGDSVRPVEAGPVHGRVVVDYGLVDIGVVDDGRVHVGDCGVIAEMLRHPHSASKADSTISEAIIHATIKADVRAPVSGVPGVVAAAKSPIAGSPQETDSGREHPSTRNPIVPLVAIRPITWSPNVLWSGTNRLNVHRQQRRRYRNGNEDTRE